MVHRDLKGSNVVLGDFGESIVLDWGLARVVAPGGDAPTRILFGGGSRAVRDVLVDGQLLVRDGALTRSDAESVRFAAAEALPALISRAGLR